MTRKRTPKATRDQLKEIDYAEKLTADEKAWLEKFYREYYNGDFGPDAIHPKDLRKDCYDRNNASKRQMHSVGEDERRRAEGDVYRKSQIPKQSWRFYLPDDYDPNRHYKNLEDDDDGEP